LARMMLSSPAEPTPTQNLSHRAFREV